MLKELFTITCWLTVFTALTVTSSCVTDDGTMDADGQQDVPVSMLFCISTKSTDTRMSEAITQQEGFRGINVNDSYFYPFKVAITDNSLSLRGTVTSNISQVNGTYYFDDRTVNIPDETQYFLCYSRAKPDPADNKFVNGSIIKHNLEKNSSVNTHNIEFAPEPILTASDDITSTQTNAASFAAYMTKLANAITDKKSDFFHEFVNYGHAIPCSKAAAVGMKNWLVSKNITIPTDLGDPPNVSILLPEGASAVTWNYSAEKFDTATYTTQKANINSLTRFVYPAELYYYANSGIKTSEESQKDNYNNNNDWSTVLGQYEKDNGKMDNTVHSVAVKEPLNYAVACLRVGIIAVSPLSIGEEQTIDLSTNNEAFPLTAIFVAGQHPQDYAFTPKPAPADEYVIYDKEISGISMGNSTSATESDIKYTNTLVLQSRDGKSVRFAMEFLNNSGQPFKGHNCTILNGTKFYLVGTINLPETQTKDEQKRVFTKDFITRGTVTIKSLNEAYSFLPDLLDPRLEVGIELVPKWIQATTTNVPL